MCFSTVRSLTAMAALVGLLLGIQGCTRVDTGEVGLRRTFNGVVEMTPLNPGYHQTLVGNVLVFSEKEIMLSLEDLHPQTKDKITMKEVDISFTYAIKRESIGELYTRYGQSSHMEEHGEIYVMAAFVRNLMASSLADEVAAHDALAVNTDRDAIQRGVVSRAVAKLKQEGLDTKVSVSQVVLKVASIPDALAESANRQAKAVNEQNALQTEVLNAQKEAAKVAALAAASTQGYTNYVKAQAMLEFAKNCKAGSMWIVPDNAQMIMQQK